MAQIPGSTFTSPGFIMGIVAFEFLYGLFLFAVMSTTKRHQAEAVETQPARPQRTTAPPLVALAEPAKPAPSKEEGPPPRAPAPAARETPPPLANAERERPPAPAEKPKRKGANRKKKSDSGKSIALAPSPKPKALTPPREQPTISPLGALIDPSHDSLVKVESSDSFTLTVPPGLHVFDVQREVADAPRALAEVAGDFLAEVKVAGEMRSGSDQVKGLNFTFQGAGLLLWQDEKNYVRFERTSFYQRDRFHRVFIETCKDGKPGKSSFRNVREGPVTLRLERKGRGLIYTYSTDGKTWIKLDQSAVSYAPKVSVGLSASNATPRIFDARFTDFSLKR